MTRLTLKKTFASSLFFLLFFALPAWGATPQASSCLKDALNLQSQGLLNFNYAELEDETYTDNKRSEIKLSAECREKFKAVVTFALDEFFEKRSFDAKDDFDTEQFVKTAYIEIRNVGGLPVAFVVGKHKIPFGQNFQPMPFKNPADSLQKFDRIIGLSIKITEFLPQFFDSVEMGIFEAERGDFSVSDGGGFSARVKKSIGDNISLAASYMQNDPQWMDGDMDRRTSLAFMVQNDEGTLKTYVEAVHLENAPKLPSEVDFTVTAGITKEITDKIDVGGEYIRFNNLYNAYSLGGWYHLKPNISLGLQAIHYDYSDESNEEDDTFLGAQLRIHWK